MVNPCVQRSLYTTELHHVIACAVGVDDGNGTYGGIGRGAAHRIAADGCKGGDAVGNVIHGVIGEHAAHREPRQIDAVAVYVVLFRHLVNQG